MTVISENRRNQYSCDGSQTVFPYTFRILDEEHIQVILTDSEGAETILALTTHYTVSGVGDAGGGNVTTVATYASGNTLTLLRNVPFTQLTDYVESDIFPAESHERGLDKLTMIIQQFAERLDRLLYLKKSSAFLNLELPDPVAQKILQWKDDLTGLKNVTPYNEGDLTVTEFIESLLDDEDATEFLGTLLLDTNLLTLSLPEDVAISAFIKTLLDDTNAATARTTLGEILRRNFAEVYAIASGTDTYTAALSPAISSYETGAHYFITFENANTVTTPTLNLNSLGAKTIKLEGGIALFVGSIPANHAAILKYDGTVMILLNPKGLPDGSVTEVILGDSVVAQAKLKTTTHAQSTTSTSWIEKLLTYADYGFECMIMKSGTGGNVTFKRSDENNPCTTGGDYVGESVWIKVVGSVTGYVRYRYVTASGEVFWIWLLRNKATKKILDADMAPDHCSFGLPDPSMREQPFPNYDPTKHEIVLINPSKDDLKLLYGRKGARSLLQVFLEDFEVDEISRAQWPKEPVTARILNDDWFERWITQKTVEIEKKVIPGVPYVLCRTFKLKIT